MSPIERKFPLIFLSGNNFEAGKQHGLKLRRQIETSYGIYKKFLFFDIPDHTLAEIGKRYLECFFTFDEEYVTEIEGIAAGACVEPWQIAALNARNELHHYLKGRLESNECTALFLPQTGILAQNWDWAREFESLALIVSRERPDGHKTLQMTEPGVIGKIGFNALGLGVCLNFLPGRNNQIGIPVHLILRSVLDSASIEEAADRIRQAESSSFSNILVANRSGKYFNLELSERRKITVTYADRIPFHTNHYIEDRGAEFSPAADAAEEELHEDSVIRFQRVRTLLGQTQERGIGVAKRILSDRRGGRHAICSDYKFIMGRHIGTVCSVVMDLKKLQMHISKGNPDQNAYEVIAMRSGFSNQ